jgi:cytochrome c-type biogenesis protein CcmH/NrfG
MKKESVLILVVVTFIVGFVGGAVSGIKFYAREHRGGEAGAVAAPGQAAPGNAPHTVSAEDISQAEAVVRKEPQNFEALVNLGNLYFDANQQQKAVGVYERALAINPKNADVRTDLGIMFRGLKDFDRAAKEFRQAASDDPSHKNSRFNLGVVLQYDKKDIKAAIAAWEDYLRVEPAGERATTVRSELEQLKALAK